MAESEERAKSAAGPAALGLLAAEVVPLAEDEGERLALALARALLADLPAAAGSPAPTELDMCEPKRGSKEER